MSEKKQISPDDDGDLVERCRKGQLDAFESLVIKYQKKMLNIAFRTVGNYEDACEVVQDAFFSAYSGIQRFEGRSSFSTWLCAIVINTSRNRLEQMKTAARHLQFSLDDPIATEDGNVRIELASDSPSALKQLENKDLRRQVQRCIDALEEEFREVLVLRDIQGFSYDEISDIIKVAQGTVKSRIFRARETMKKCLKEVIGD